MPEQKSYVVVIGGSNIDIGGKSNEKIVPRDSNPGTIKISTGGVGHNIALNLSRLNVPVYFFSALGDDTWGSFFIEEAKNENINLEIPPFKNAFTGIYLFINGCKGELEIAINDMSINSKITPELLDLKREFIQKAKIVIADANIPKNTIEYLSKITNNLIIDPVSTIKMHKLDFLWKGIHTLKPNKLEAEEISGIQIDSEDSLKRACNKILDMGVENLLISLGVDGACFCNKKKFVLLPIFESSNIINTSGAGDSFLAGYCFSFFMNEKKEFEREIFALQCALAMASLTVEVEETVHPKMNRELLINRLKITEYEK